MDFHRRAELLQFRLLACVFAISESGGKAVRVKEYFLVASNMLRLGESIPDLAHPLEQVQFAFRQSLCDLESAISCNVRA